MSICIIPGPWYDEISLHARFLLKPLATLQSPRKNEPGFINTISQRDKSEIAVGQGHQLTPPTIQISQNHPGVTVY